VPTAGCTVSDDTRRWMQWLEGDEPDLVLSL
jgi:hypothetical protein